jgi:hypothetical protein
MPAFGLIPPPYRVIGVFVLLAVLAGTSAALAWRVQDWRYGRQLAEQSDSQAQTLNQLAQAAVNLQQAELSRRQALEQRLSTIEQTHYRVLSDAQRDQGRLRDRLATADLRLSVLLDSRDAAADCEVPATTGTSGLDHGTRRARLDPAHAERIIAITDDGDRALIALQACQAYIKALVPSHLD